MPSAKSYTTNGLMPNNAHEPEQNQLRLFKLVAQLSMCLDPSSFMLQLKGRFCQVMRDVKATCYLLAINVLH